MDAILVSLGGLSSFALYFVSSLVLLVLFKLLYALVTPHDEWRLVKEDRNAAAAIGFVGAILGFSLAVASAATYSVSYLDFLIWGVIALLAQILAFAVVRFVFMPKIVQRINNDEISAGIMLGGISVAVGLLNAACIAY